MSTKRVILTILATSALILGLGIGFHFVRAQYSTSEYLVQPGIIAGGDYQLTSLACPVSGVAFGGNYRLVNQLSSGPWGNCCCTYLPILNR